MTRIAPNPHSPYASANPDVRHIFPSPIFFPAPTPGVLAPAACNLMAVVPDELIETQPGAPLPDGLCADCVTVMQGGNPSRTSAASSASPPGSPRCCPPTSTTSNRSPAACPSSSPSSPPAWRPSTTSTAN
jgi:hypothetical protein